MASDLHASGGVQRRAPAPVSRLPILSRAMWLAWLLRSDIRQGAAPGDLEAQREFVVWWLLWGRKEYPAVWYWTQSRHKSQCRPFRWHLVCRVRACSGVSINPALICSTRSYYVTRMDWRNYSAGTAWYGPSELDVAPQLPEPWLAMTEAPQSAGGAPRIALTLARRIPNPPPHVFDTPQLIADWYREYGRNLLPAPMSPSASPHAAADIPQRVPHLIGGGVNLVGFVRGHTGLGEDVRMAAAALKAASIAHVLIDVPASSTSPQPDVSPAGCLRYNVTIYCMSAFDTAGLYPRSVLHSLPDRTRHRLLAMELPRFPDIWDEVYTLIDEIWTGSMFTRSAYSTSDTIPVHRLPCPVELPRIKPLPRPKLRLLNDKAFDPFIHSI